MIYGTDAHELAEIFPSVFRDDSTKLVRHVLCTSVEGINYLDHDLNDMTETVSVTYSTGLVYAIVQDPATNALIAFALGHVEFVVRHRKAARAWMS